MPDIRQLWFISLKSDFRDQADYWRRFDHWQFFFPNTPVRRMGDLGDGIMVDVNGSPFTGFSAIVEPANAQRTDVEFDAKLLMPEIDLDDVRRIVKDLGGLSRSENPDSGEPNCQNWLYILAGMCEEEGIMGEHVKRFLKAIKQR
ncbi:hypothetical protein H072_11044 [Dactylellina haptotyla CBS 200.50]|uniref:Uncharacterized protein n=1 Tax=Dactylellina haptotyla (strain CBS 200.50) TaxID=1284197 RepID=S8A2Y9_DACHA|nr:hypothetical protein H072_11044 [Dactylellina haptotyla CBS 200.50]